MRYIPELSTYSHNSQKKKKNQKEKNDYYYSFNLFNPQGTNHVLLTGDILTCYEQKIEVLSSLPWLIRRNNLAVLKKDSPFYLRLEN